jgi:hypothetical protein
MRGVPLMGRMAPSRDAKSHSQTQPEQERAI